jgi:hypothetical protein
VSDTPRTDRARLDEHDPAVAVASECSKLECQLNAANERIKRLEQENDALRADLLLWDKAGIGFTTEDKP